MQLSAHDLAENLADTMRFRRYLAVTEMQIQDLDPGRADVVAVPQFRPGCPIVFEVKVSRGDFLADTRAEKCRRYAEVAEVIFATERGLVKKNEVPDWAGLTFFYKDRGWVMQKPGVAPSEIAPEKLNGLYRRIAARYDQYRLNNYRIEEIKRNLEFRPKTKVGKAMRRILRESTFASIDTPEGMAAAIKRVEHIFLEHERLRRENAVLEFENERLARARPRKGAASNEDKTNA